MGVREPTPEPCRHYHVKQANVAGPYPEPVICQGCGKRWLTMAEYHDDHYKAEPPSSPAPPPKRYDNDLDAALGKLGRPETSTPRGPVDLRPGEALGPRGAFIPDELAADLDHIGEHGYLRGTQVRVELPADRKLCECGHVYGAHLNGRAHACSIRDCLCPGFRKVATEPTPAPFVRIAGLETAARAVGWFFVIAGVVAILYGLAAVFQAATAP